MPLAPLDSGYNRDWDPQAQKSFLADITKACRLLAYQYVQFTEPQEAVRRAVSDILQNPTYVKEPQMNAWVPGKFDAEAVKTVAATLLRRAVGPQMVGSESKGGVLPRDSRKLGVNLMKAGATVDKVEPRESGAEIAQAAQARHEQGQVGGLKPEGGKDITAPALEPKPPVAQPQIPIPDLHTIHTAYDFATDLNTAYNNPKTRTPQSEEMRANDLNSYREVQKMLAEIIRHARRLPRPPSGMADYDQQAIWASYYLFSAAQNAKLIGVTEIPEALLPIARPAPRGNVRLRP